MSVIEQGGTNRYATAEHTESKEGPLSAIALLLDRAKSALEFVGGHRVGVPVLQQCVAVQLHEAAHSSEQLGVRLLADHLTRILDRDGNHPASGPRPERRVDRDFDPGAVPTVRRRDEDDVIDFR